MAKRQAAQHLDQKQMGTFEYVITDSVIKKLKSNDGIAIEPISIFTSEEGEWRIQISRNLCTTDLFLKLCNSHKTEIKATFKFTIFNQRCEAYASKSSTICKFVPGTANAAHGFRDIVPIAELKSGMKIRCDLNVVSKAVNCCCQQFRDLFETRAFSDVTINVGGQTLRAHKVILATRSRVFWAMFEHEMAEKMENQVVISDVDYETFEEMLRFIYTNEVKNINKMPDKLLAAADKYELMPLKDKCEEVLGSSLKIKNAVVMLEFADRHNAGHLKARAAEFINSNIREVLETENFQLMTKSRPLLMVDILRASANPKKMKLAEFQ